MIPTKIKQNYSTFLLILLISLPAQAKLNEPELKCKDLPHSDFLTVQELDRACAHRRMWLHDRDTNGGKDFVDKITGKLFVYRLLKANF
jgi:hypothetical protein